MRGVQLHCFVLKQLNISWSIRGILSLYTQMTVNFGQYPRRQQSFQTLGYLGDASLSVLIRVLPAALRRGNLILYFANTELCRRRLAEPLKFVLNSLVIYWLWCPSLWAKHQWDLVFQLWKISLSALTRRSFLQSQKSQPSTMLALRQAWQETTYCLAVISKAYLALSLTPQLTEQFLSPFEAVRPGTEVFSTIWMVFGLIG